MVSIELERKTVYDKKTICYTSKYGLKYYDTILNILEAC